MLLRIYRCSPYDRLAFRSRRTWHQVPSGVISPAGHSHNRQTRCSACARPGWKSQLHRSAPAPQALVRHKGLDHMRRLLKAPLGQRTLTRLPNHQATHARQLTRYKQVLPALVALKQNHPIIKQLHRVPFLSLLFSKSIAGRWLYTEHLFVYFLLSCPHGMVWTYARNRAPPKERPCISPMQPSYATGSIFSRPPM